jgi:hypothetical protein
VMASLGLKCMRETSTSSHFSDYPTYQELSLPRALLPFKSSDVMLLAMEPTPLKRVFFWTTYVLGTLAFIFGLLLTDVPRGRNDKDFTLEFLFWGGCFLVLGTSLMLMRTSGTLRPNPAARQPPHLSALADIDSTALSS